MVLALVGAPAAPMTYAAYQALKVGGGALAEVLLASEAAALAAIAGTTALAVGAGIGGFLLGQAILRNLGQPTTMPPMGEFFKAGEPGGRAFVVFDYYLNGVQIYDGVSSLLFDTPATGPYKGMNGSSTIWFMLGATGLKTILAETTNTSSGTRLNVREFRTAANQPLPPTSRRPSYVPTRPDSPVPASPTPITIPGLPPFPISPVVVPNPGNEPGEDNEERPPGIVVQIPQTGQQLTFSPDGVRLGNYASPTSRPFIVPQAPIPPGGKTATPPCCPEPEPTPSTDKSAEIICRLKTLQTEILNDGTDRTSGATPAAPSGFYEELAADFYKVVMRVTQRPSNLRIQSSTSPAADVWFVGWFAWVENGFPGERLPLQFENQTFLAPKNVTGFVYQVNFGCLAIATWQRRVKRPYIDNCVSPVL